MKTYKAYKPMQSAIPIRVAVDLQDHLITACCDLDRLQALLADACGTLMQSFRGSHDQIVAMQFQDISAQLIQHTHHRLRSCADVLASDVFIDDEDGPALAMAPPLRPNPVTRTTMEAGSIELF